MSISIVFKPGSEPVPLDDRWDRAMLRLGPVSPDGRPTGTCHEALRRRTATKRAMLDQLQAAGRSSTED